MNENTTRLSQNLNSCFYLHILLIYLVYKYSILEVIPKNKLLHEHTVLDRRGELY